MTVSYWRRSSAATTFDVGLAASVAAVTVAGTVILTAGRDVDAVGSGLLIGTALPLAFRRGRPRAALAATVLLSFVYDVAGYPAAFYTLPIALVLYSVVDAGFGWVGAAVAGGAVAVFLVVGVVLGRGHVTDLTNALWFAGWLVASLVLGEVTRGRRAYVEQVEQRAVEAERGREEEARRRIGEERIRIARELHDILAHRISSISVQAGMGVHVFDRDPEQARKALAAISVASREALQELRATLGVLRQIDDGPEPRSPSPGLAQLDGVIADAAASGVEVALAVDGEPRDLPSGVDLAAYRIIEEALTNVVRHANAARAQIAIRYRPAVVEIEVEDDGIGAVAGGDAGPGGNGLLGMRERAETLGGELEAGPREGGGFRVRARLPTPGAP
jgi:signal transduction histidine kinase